MTMPPPSPRISFVVPVRNDAARLRRCLASIRRLRYAPDRLEILVADNGSTDASPSVAREAGATVLAMPGICVAEMRNRAATAAQGDVLAFIDADHEIDDIWAASAVETLGRPGVAAVGAQYESPGEGTWVQRQYDRLRQRDVGVRETSWLASGNLAVWRTCFDRIGGFDVTLETCEDVDFCQRLRGSGHTVMSDARLRSTHFGDPSTLRELFFGELWRGRDNIRVSLRPPLLARNILSIAIPVAELVCLSLLVMGVATWPLGGGRFAFAGAAGIAGITVLQTARMWRRRAVRAIDVLQTPAVACVYGVARALAPIVRAPHQLRQGVRSRA